MEEAKILPSPNAGHSQEQPPPNQEGVLPKPVLIKLGDQVLTGLARGEGFRDIEWDWNRVVQNTEMKTQKDHYYLKRNWESFRPEFQAAQIPMDDLSIKASKSSLMPFSSTA